MSNKNDLQCRCGNRIGNDERLNHSICHTSRGEHENCTGIADADTFLGSSFVHLSKPYLYTFSDGDMNDSAEFHQGFIVANEYMKQLINLAEGRFDRFSVRSPFICGSCLYRVAAALEHDSARLYSECDLYMNFVLEEEEKAEQLERVIQRSFNTERYDNNNSPSFSSNGNFHFQLADLLDTTVDNYENEISKLRDLCDEHERNIEEMLELLREQVNLSTNLLHQEEDLLTDLNFLEGKSRRLEEMNSYLIMKCVDVRREVSSLSRVQLHSTLFHISIDNSGWRYPLINSLRLAHKPKGDLRWSEINAAWAQASQLLLFLGNSFRFSSPNLRIVPLTTCSKIIEVDKGKRIMHHLGVEFESSTLIISSEKRLDNIIHSIRSFHQLLMQIITHVRSLQASSFLWNEKNFEVESLNGYDEDVGNVINKIALCLKCLSENATANM